MVKKLQKLLAYRQLNILAFIFSCAILVYAGYAQLHDNLEPCPLCVMQRVIFAILGILFLFGALHIGGKRGRQVLHSFIFIFGIIGIAIACRHIYLQHIPADLAPSCGPGLNFIVKNLPPSEALRLMLMGTGECARITWHLFGLTMPEWSLICFILLSALNIRQFFQKNVKGNF